MPWVTPSHPRRADLDACVTCGLCLPVCPTFRLTGDETASPRGRLAAIAAVDTGIADVDRRFDEVTDFCLQCRACESACPSLVPYGEIIESARAEAIAQIPHRSTGIRRFLLGRALANRWFLRGMAIVAAMLQRIGLLRRLPVIGVQTTGLRRLGLTAPSVVGRTTGDPRGEPISLFTGCVADAWFPGLHTATIDVLTEAGYRVDAPPSQTCCGALAAHGGFAEEARRLASRNVAAFEGPEVIAVDVAGCGAHLKGLGRYGPAAGLLAGRARDVTEIVALAIGEGRLPTLDTNGMAVVLQDPCHLEHGQRVIDDPVSVLAAAGYEVVRADPGGLCCGAAGLYQFDHPETAVELGQQKAARIIASGASLVATANVGCEMQLRRHLPPGTEILHPVEIYAAALTARS